jgi:iron complex outermembrane receptor protein
VPLASTDEVAVQYGGSGALWGSGAVGGSVHLNGGAPAGEGWGAFTRQAAGSFGTYAGAYGGSWRGKAATVSARLYNQYARNDFPFRNTAQFNAPEVRQPNAGLRQYGATSDLHLLLSEREQLDVHYWFGNNDRHIPPSMTTESSIATQADDFHRVAAQWKRTGDALNLAVRSAFFAERLAYRDQTVDSRSRTRSSITEAEASLPLGSALSLNAGLHHTYEWADVESYTNPATRYRTALFASLKARDARERFTGLVSIRQERAGTSWVPVIPSLGGTLQLAKPLKLRLNATRNYRLPTFNDLYWQPGGNRALQPEEGWSQDAGLTFKHAFGTLRTEVDVTVYNSRIHNWIVWLPRGSNWAPTNLQFVWSRGVEVTARVAQPVGLFTLTGTGFYGYGRSTNEKERFPGDQALHKQLTYTPRHQAAATLGAARGPWTLLYNHRYTGSRYPTSDETGPLPAYQVGTLTLGRSLTFRTLSFDLQGRINNLWNASYQVIAWQAMPGRSFQLTLFTQFQPSTTR